MVIFGVRGGLRSPDPWADAHKPLDWRIIPAKQEKESYMRRYSAVIGLWVAVLLYTIVGAAGAQEWEETVSQEGAFKVLLPKGAQSSVQDVKTDVGTIRQHFLLVEVENGNLAYLVGYADYPEDHIRRTGPETLLSNGQRGLVRHYNGTLDKDFSISLSGHPGKEIHGSGTEEGVPVYFSRRSYLVGNRLYSILALRMRQDLDLKAVHKLFASFALISE